MLMSSVPPINFFTDASITGQRRQLVLQTAEAKPLAVEKAVVKRHKRAPNAMHVKAFLRLIPQVAYRVVVLGCNIFGGIQSFRKCSQSKNVKYQQRCRQGMYLSGRGSIADGLIGGGIMQSAAAVICRYCCKMLYTQGVFCSFCHLAARRLRGRRIICFCKN